MRCLACVLTACLLCAGSALATPLGSDFTYQGQLTDSGTPASGLYDLQFALFVAAAGGNAVDTVTLTSQTVSGGSINASLDFTDAPYNGQALWVEVSVRHAASGSYVALAPRQAITATPYALFALSGNPGPMGPPGPPGTAGVAGTTGAQGVPGFVTLPYSGTASGSAAALQVQNTGMGTAIAAVSSGSGLAGAALNAQGSGIGAIITNTSTDTALLLGNNVAGNGGSLLTAFVPAGIFKIDGLGNIASPSSASFGTGVSGSSSSGTAMQGTSISGKGVSGSSSSGTAVRGTSGSGIGVDGESSGVGVYGSSGSVTTLYTNTAGVLGTSGSGTGVFGGSTSGDGTIGESSQGDGVHGFSSTGSGVHGSATGTTRFTGAAGVWGDSPSYYGVWGTSYTNNGVTGNSDYGDGVAGGSTYAKGVHGYASNDYAVYASGNFGATGTKNFIEPHPTDPGKEIRYASLEGPEVGTYFRGTAHLTSGHATITIPEDFRMVTAENGLTVQLTAIGQPANLYCVTRSLARIEVAGSLDIEFDYQVNGVRKAFIDFQPVVANSDFKPSSRNDQLLTLGLPAESVRRLIANGTLHPDGSINLETAHRLGWDQRPSWNNPSIATATPAPNSAHQ